MDPTNEHPRALTTEGPGPVPVRLEPHTHEDRLVLRRPSLPTRLSGSIRRHPGPALLVAACAGFVVGRLIRFAFRSLRAR